MLLQLLVCLLGPEMGMKVRQRAIVRFEGVEAIHAMDV